MGMPWNTPFFFLPRKGENDASIENFNMFLLSRVETRHGFFGLKVCYIDYTHE